MNGVDILQRDSYDRIKDDEENAGQYYPEKRPSKSAPHEMLQNKWNKHIFDL